MKRSNYRNIIASKSGFIAVAIIAVMVSLFCLAFKPMQDEDDAKPKWVAPPSADNMVNPLTANEKYLQEAQALYKNNCEQCHGVKGKGDGWQSQNVAKKIAAISSPSIQKQSDGALFWKITTGNKPMPGMKKDLTSDQRWKLVLYVRELGKESAK